MDLVVCWLDITLSSPRCIALDVDRLPRKIATSERVPTFSISLTQRTHYSCQHTARFRGATPRPSAKRSDDSKLTACSDLTTCQTSHVPEGRARGRTVQWFNFGDPLDDWELYLQGVLTGRACVLQIDRSTWLAELIDLDEEFVLVN